MSPQGEKCLTVLTLKRHLASPYEKNCTFLLNKYPKTHTSQRFTVGYWGYAWG